MCLVLSFPLICIFMYVSSFHSSEPIVCFTTTFILYYYLIDDRKSGTFASSHSLHTIIMNFLRLSEHISDEATSVRYLQQHERIQAQRFCKNGHEMKLFLDAEDRWRCHVRECRQNKDLCTNNWLVGLKLPLRKVILFIYSWSRKITSVKFSKDELEIAQNAVVNWNNYLRGVCVWKLQQTQMTIGRPNSAAEIDENCSVKEKIMLDVYCRNSGICRETREYFMKTVPDRSAATLLPFITSRVKPETTIITDKWRA